MSLFDDEYHDQLVSRIEELTEQRDNAEHEAKEAETRTETLEDAIDYLYRTFSALCPSTAAAMVNENEYLRSRYGMEEIR